MGRGKFSSTIKRLYYYFAQKFEQNNNKNALNILYAEKNTKKINIVYKSKYNNKRKKQVILLMIGDGKKYHYLAVTNLSGLL